MFTCKVWTDDSRLLQESNLAARQQQGATSVIQAITGEGLAQGPCIRGGYRDGGEPTTFRTEGTGNLHLANHARDNTLRFGDEDDCHGPHCSCRAPKLLINNKQTIIHRVDVIRFVITSIGLCLYNKST